MAAKYKLNPAGFRKNVLQSDFMLAEMEYRANRIKDTAEAIAPKYTGAYARRFRLRTTRRGGVNKDRAAGIVYNIDPAGLSIEFGSTRSDGTRVAGHYTLTTALDSA